MLDAPVIRRQALLSALQGLRGRTTTLTELGNALGVSARTVRRDCRWLSHRGHGVSVRDAQVSFEAVHTDVLASEDELLAKIAAHAHLDGLTQATWDPHLQPLKDSIAREVRNLYGHALEPWRFQAPTAHERTVDPQIYRAAVYATHAHQRIRVDYLSRSGGQPRDHVLTPQLVRRWRGAYYIIGLCEGSDLAEPELRTLALDRIHAIVVLGPGRAVDRETMERYCGLSYGIFCGEPEAWADLRIDATQAAYFDTPWHPNERRTVEDDGNLRLLVPYANSKEIVATILSAGQGIEVLGPEELREEVTDVLRATLMRYAS